MGLRYCTVHLLLYKDIARDGILLPALVLPFYMVHPGALEPFHLAYPLQPWITIGRPESWAKWLNRIDAFLLFRKMHPQAKPVRSDAQTPPGSCVIVVVALVLAIVVFLYFLVG